MFLVIDYSLVMNY